MGHADWSCEWSFRRGTGATASLGALAIFTMALAVSPVPAAAQPFSWLLPAGGETWTAGTTHSIEWTGGTPSGNVSIVLAQLEAGCMEGYSIAPGSVVIDATILPVGFCLVTYTGAFVAEAAGMACCCPDAVPAEDVNWGTVKSLYR